MTFTNASMRMLQIVRLATNWKIWRDSRGQDLIEYSLMAGFVTVAAAAIVPGVYSGIHVIFSQAIRS
jgi:Flp pilus assembly pilin Flp